MTYAKYYCDDVKKFYFVREEILPVNINVVNISSINNKKIRGCPLTVNEKCVLSISQSLEWFKYVSICPILDDIVVFNPY